MALDVWCGVFGRTFDVRGHGDYLEPCERYRIFAKLLPKRGAVAYLNDLHKGRNTGTVWFWFLDIFSVACVVFSLTGLWLLQIHAGKRASTWPLTVLGFVVPAVIALVFIH